MTELPANLIDDAVITKPQALVLLGVSRPTLDRMRARGEGPKQVQLSDRRIGYRMRDLRAWLNERAG